MHPELAKLLVVQDLDREIRRLREELARYPDFYASKEVEIGRARSKALAARAEALELEKQIRVAEGDVREMRETLRKFMAQQASVKNQREYDLLTGEIAKVEQRIDEADTKGLELLSMLEAVQAKLPTIEAMLESEEKEYKQEIERLDERKREKSAHLEACIQQREQAAREVDGEMMRRYERLSHLYPGTCVAPVEDGICGGCYMKILSRRQQELARPDGMAECDSCHRFLYARGGGKGE